VYEELIPIIKRKRLNDENNVRPLFALKQVGEISSRKGARYSSNIIKVKSKTGAKGKKTGKSLITLWWDAVGQDWE